MPAGLFWDMHDALLENQSRLSIPTIFLIAEELGLPETAMRNALETGQFRKKVRGDFMSGIRSGVNGTPTFFINGVRHDGGYDYASLETPDAPCCRYQRVADLQRRHSGIATQKYSTN